MKLLNTESYLLLIYEEAEIKEKDYFVNTIQKEVYHNNIKNYNVDKEYLKLIIAYYPLSKEAKELDLPLLPPFEENIDVKALKLGLKEYPYRDINNDLALGGFIRGYKAAQSKQSFSLEDIKKAIEMAKTLVDGKQEFEIENILGSSDGTYGISEKYTEEEIIQSLSTQQLPKEFVLIEQYQWDRTCNECKKGFDFKDIVDTKYNSCPHCGSFKHAAVIYDKYKTITNSEGKQELVGAYKY